MQQPRVEPYVGTSSSWRNSSSQVHPADVATCRQKLAADSVFTHGPSNDHGTLELGPVEWDAAAEQTIDIPINDLCTDTRAERARDSSSSATSGEVGVGTTLCNRYVLHRLIGTGGTCRVFLAEDLYRRLTPDAAGELIALKVLRPSLRHLPHSLQRLRREFLQMQQLTHPAIARVFDLNCDGDVWFMTMELVDANSALAWMEGEYSNAEGLRLILSCCEAVAYAHRKGIVHGDLKPGNVLVLGDGRVKLIDFGSVASDDETAKGATKLEATPQYASPSVLAGNMAEVSDDVFGLGCLAYMVLARGRHPFDRKPSNEAARAHLRVPYLSGIPVRLFEVVARALAWDPTQRHASVRELQHALLSAELSADPEPAPPRPTAHAAPKSEPRTAIPETKAAATAPPPAHDRPKHPPGDFSYLSKFRGYVAGPHMDASRAKSNEPAPERRPAEQPVQPRYDPPLESQRPVPQELGPQARDSQPVGTPPRAPVTPESATTFEPDSAAPYWEEPDSFDPGAVDPDSVDPDSVDLDSVDLDSVEPDFGKPHSVELERFDFGRISETPAAIASARALTSTAPERVQESRRQRSPFGPSMGRGARVYATAFSLALLTVVGAALWSHRSALERSAPAPVARSMQLPELTIPTPVMQTVPMPSVRIARLEADRTKSDKPRTAKPTLNKGTLDKAKLDRQRTASNQPGSDQSRSNRRRSAATANSETDRASDAKEGVSFAARGVAVSPNQTLVAIPLRRSAANRGAVRVAWQIEGERGRQLLDVNRAGDQVIQFHEGQATRVLYVPLRKEAGELVADGVRSFRVKLRQMDEAAGSMPESEIRVTLLDAS